MRSVRIKVKAPTEPNEQPVASEALITKYRPKQWGDVIGQHSAVRATKAAIQAGTHTFLFVGEAGVGKTTFARLVASELGCEVLEIDAASKSGVDDMRETVAAQVYMTLTGTGRRAVIVDECHRLSKEAFTALLKPTEEPGGHVYYMLCTSEPSKLPATVTSRCSVIKLGLYPEDDLFRLLRDVADNEQFTAHDDVLEVIARISGGSMRRALSLLSTHHDLQHPNEVDDTSEDKYPELIELLRSLVSSRLQWKQVAEFVSGTKESPETIRIITCNYVAKVLAGTTDSRKAPNLMAILEAFERPFDPTTKMAPVLLAFGRLLF